MDLSLTGSFQLQLLVEANKIDAAVGFYSEVFGALVVNHITNQNGHVVYNLLIAGTKVSVSQSENSHGTNVMVENLLETEDVHSIVDKATASGAQLVGKIFYNDDARLQAKITDPFGFHWVVLSLWTKSRMERCNICRIYPAHAPALCSEYRMWKHAQACFPNLMPADTRMRMSALNAALKTYEKLASDLECKKVGYLSYHYSDFQKPGCLLPKIISDVHVHLELLRSTEIAMFVNPSIRDSSAVKAFFYNIQTGCSGLVKDLPSMSENVEQWSKKSRLERRRLVAFYSRQFLKSMMEWRSRQDGATHTLTKQMDDEMMKVIVTGSLRQQEYF